MATGNFIVSVICAEGKLAPARVIGYDEERMTIKVKFVNDNLTMKDYVREYHEPGFMVEEGDYTLVEKDVPIKEFQTFFTSIKL